MKQPTKSKSHFLLSARMIMVMLIISSIVTIANSALVKTKHVTDNAGKVEDPGKDSIESVKAFADVYKVLMHPRCMNCHPKGDVPLQGDDNHPHTMAPKRGKDGHGLYAMKCSNCHQPENTPGLHTPPGNPKWGL